MLIATITSMKTNSIVNIKREESMNHLIQKILKIKNQFYDVIQNEENKLRGMKNQILQLKRSLKVVLSDKKAKIKILNQNIKSFMMENKSLKLSSTQMQIGNSELLDRLKKFEDYGLDLNNSEELEQFKRFQQLRNEPQHAEIQTDNSASQTYRDQYTETDPDLDQQDSQNNRSERENNWDSSAYRLKIYMDKIEEKDQVIHKLTKDIQKFSSSNFELNNEINFLQQKNSMLEVKIGK